MFIIALVLPTTSGADRLVGVGKFPFGIPLVLCLAAREFYLLRVVPADNLPGDERLEARELILEAFFWKNLLLAFPLAP